MIVSRFGLHVVPGGISFLIQDKSAQNLISPELKFPHIVQTSPRNLRCPHQIDLSIGVGVTLPSWIDDPLLRAFLPLPHEGPATLVHDPDDRFRHAAATLARMSSPTGPVGLPAWMLVSKRLQQEYASSNLSPIVLTSTEHNDTLDLHRHIELAGIHRRRLIVFTRERFPLFGNDIAWVTPPEYLPLDEPLEAIGAAALRKHMLDATA